jgi:hypothetical protein
VGFYAWYTRPAAVVTHGKAKVVDGRTMARVLAVIDAARRGARDDIEAHGGLRRDVRAVVVASPSPPLLRMVFEAMNLVATLTTGVRMSHVQDVPEVVRTHRLEPPGPLPAFLARLG